ncbi:MAG: citrate/2-methylcitrate synthase [Acidobacteriota bacterium]
MTTARFDTPPPIHSGLEGVTFAETRLSRVDGEAGSLVLAGFPVEEIAPRVSFEAMTLLLVDGRSPTEGAVADLRRDLESRRRLPEATLDLLRQAASSGAPPMDALRAAAGTLGLGGPAESGRSRLSAEELAVLAGLPAIVAAYSRLLRGLEPVDPGEGRSTAAAFLHGVDGEEPSPARVRALDTYLNTVCDHGANASTFTARVITSTGSDLVSAVVGALGALKGPLHGGAPGPALDMVLEIGSAAAAEPWLRGRLEAGERLMGFGHRVYKVRDPRAAVLAGAAEALYGEDGDADLYTLFRHVEAEAVRLLGIYKPGRRLQANVELYTALLLHGLGLGSEWFTPVFAVARAAGWIAHAREQRAEGRLIRPRLAYRGAVDRRLEGAVGAPS